MAQGGKNLMQAISIASLRMPDALQLDKLLNQTVERRLLQDIRLLYSHVLPPLERM